jgi:small-conductance mechanosensitive channel
MNINLNNSGYGKSLQLNELAKDSLNKAATWAKFLAVVQFVVSALLVIFAIILGAIDPQFGAPGIGTGGLVATYLLGAVVYIVLGYFLYDFADKAKKAVATASETELTTSLKQLHLYFKISGILIIVALVLVLLAGIIGAIAAATM